MAMLQRVTQGFGDMYWIAGGCAMQILDVRCQFQPVVMDRIEVCNTRLQFLVKQRIQHRVDLAIKQGKLPLDNRSLADRLERDFAIKANIRLEGNAKSDRMEVCAWQIN